MRSASAKASLDQAKFCSTPRTSRSFITSRAGKFAKIAGEVVSVTAARENAQLTKIFIYCNWEDFLRRLWEGYLPPLLAPSYPRLDAYGLTMERTEDAVLGEDRADER